MESLPELENLTAAQDRPKSKWKRPVIWSVVVVLVLVNVYYLATSLLPRWAPKFTRRYIPHPTALARVLATQLEKGDSKAAEETGIKIKHSWFVVNESLDEAVPTPWAQNCFREVFIRGDEWEKRAVLWICAAFQCPVCLDVIAAEIPKMDTDSKKLTALALARMKTPAALTGLRKLLSDPDAEVRKHVIDATSRLDIWFTDEGDKLRVLELLRGAMKVETDPTVKLLGTNKIASIRVRAMRGMPKVIPDEELLSILRSPFTAAKWQLSADLANEQFRGRLDVSWYQPLNEIFKQSLSMEVRGNAALILVLADDPQSEEKLKYIESLCDPKLAPLPLTKEKILQELSDYSPTEPTINAIRRRWNPNPAQTCCPPRPDGSILEE